MSRQWNNNIIALLVCALSVYAAGIVSAEQKVVILETKAGCPVELASVEPLIITAAYPAAVTAKNPAIPSIRQTGLGGGDAGQPGDKAVFLLSKMKTGKGYYRSNDSITVTLDTSGLTSDVWFEFDHITSKYGSRKLTVYLDDEMLLGQFDCKVKPYYKHRRVAGRLPISLLTDDRHSITFVEAKAVNYAAIDSIQLRGKGLRIITSDNRSLSAAELNTEQSLRTSHLPKKITMPKGRRGFDFSTSQSSVWKRGGCLRVTPETLYQAKRNFGWVPHGTAITAGTIAGGDALRGDYNACKAKEKEKTGTLCEFRVDLPNGRYNMMVIAGLAPFTKKIQRKT
ncbi:MAG: hypothetical protein QF493_13540, partial [Rhodospirillales bacterium]|nr:hypothetical protein [Rhodospirillales bacterium]